MRHSDRSRNLRKQSDSPSAGPERKRLLAACLLLLFVGGVVAAVYWPVLSAGAVSVDDELYLQNNPMVENPGWASASRILREVLEPSRVIGYYQPLSIITVMLDYASGGRIDNLYPFHRTSLALHVLNTLLVIVLLYWLLEGVSEEAGYGRLIVATMIGLLFGLHPLTVEPIVWVGERKTPLAAFFVLLSLILYVLYARWSDAASLTKSGGSGSDRRILYCACLFTFLLALLSKPTSTPLPALLLLLDYWPLRRLRWKALLEKAPFFVLSGVFSVITVISTARTSGVEYPGDESTMRLPILIVYRLMFYMGKIVWPVDLTSVYPPVDPPTLANPVVLAALIGAVVLVAAIGLSLRRTRAALVGAIFFIVAIAPMLGVVGWSWVSVSDKYVYVPAIGLLLFLAWLLYQFWCFSPASPWLRWRRGGIVLVVLVLAVLEAKATRGYLACWSDTERLGRRMVDMAPKAPVLRNLLGKTLARQKRFDEAIAQYQEALRLKPDYSEAQISLGVTLYNQGKVQDSIQQYRQALVNRPHSAKLHSNLGLALMQAGQNEEAIGHFEEALRYDPYFADAYHNLGAALLAKGDTDGAIKYLARALQLKKDAPRTHYNLGCAFAQKGRMDEAIACFAEALRYDSRMFDAHYNLGVALMARGRMAEAIDAFSKASRLRPNDPNTHFVLAEAMARQGRRDDAIREYREVLRLAPDHAESRKQLEMLTGGQNPN